MILCVLVHCVLSAAYGVINDDRAATEEMHHYPEHHTMNRLCCQLR